MPARWKDNPLGFAVVDETRAGVLAVQHVSCSDGGVTLTGLWLLPDPDAAAVENLLGHRIPLGTRDGITLVEALIGGPLPSADLADLAAACEQANADLVAAWQDYRDAEPVKRANLKPLTSHPWPAVTDDGDAARILTSIGRQPHPQSTPDAMRDVIALSRLAAHLLGEWHELEGERLARAYLHNGDTTRHLYPPAWLVRHQPYWPAAV